jgi:SAM-dependent methyltransferase
MRRLRPAASDPLDGVEVADWWNRVHQRTERLWLTGSDPAHVWRFLGVSDRLLPGQTVLDIGVGEGQMSRALHARGLRVSALDIAPVALDRVRDITERQFLPAQLDTLPPGYFDWALSYLVAQHMSDDALRAQITAVVRSLKPGGILAMQFADVPGFDRSRRNSPAEQKMGGEVRGPAEMARLVEGAGGRIVWHGEPWVIPSAGGAVFYAVHVHGVPSSHHDTFTVAPRRFSK